MNTEQDTGLRWDKVRGNTLHSKSNRSAVGYLYLLSSCWTTADSAARTYDVYMSMSGCLESRESSSLSPQAQHARVPALL